MKLLIKMAVHEFECESFIDGYHIYEDTRSSTIGKNILAIWKGDTELQWQMYRSSFEKWHHHRPSPKGVIMKNDYALCL